jgi:hypothetical protein
MIPDKTKFHTIADILGVSPKMASCDIISDILDITTFSEPPKPLISWRYPTFWSCQKTFGI